MVGQYHLADAFPRIKSSIFYISQLGATDTRFGNLLGWFPSHNGTISRAILRKLCGISGFLAQEN